MLFYQAVAIFLLQLLNFESVFGIVCKDKAICFAKASEMENFWYKKMFEVQDENWDEKDLVHELTNVFYSKGSQFRDELKRLKLETLQDNDQRMRFKQSVKLNERSFFNKYNLEENLKSYNTMIGLAEMNMGDAITELCRDILRDARHVAEPLNPDNNSMEDNCDKSNLVIVSDAMPGPPDMNAAPLYMNAPPDVQMAPNFGPISDECLSGVPDVTGDQPTSRNFPGSIIVSAPYPADNMNNSNAYVPKPINNDYSNSTATKNIPVPEATPSTNAVKDAATNTVDAAVQTDSKQFATSLPSPISPKPLSAKNTPKNH